MATDTKVTELVLNELTEEKLKELEDAGTVPPNEIFFTDDDETSPRGLPLGTIIPAAVISDDASLHLLDGSSLLQNGIYKQFCDWLKARVLANSASVPTCTIAEYANEMTTYGQCGKFVINNTSSVQVSGNYRVEANSIKLPTITEFIASNNGGDDIGLAELDEIRQHRHMMPLSDESSATSAGGGLSVSAVRQNWQWTASGLGTASVGGEETKPKNVRYPYYIVVASSVKTDVEVDIDNVASDINNINGVLNRTEQKEIIYDATNSDKDWGYSGGITNGTTITGKDFTKYKRLRIYVSLSWLVHSGSYDVDLNNNYNQNAITGNNVFYCDYANNILFCYESTTTINSEKTSLTHTEKMLGHTGWVNNGIVIYKIEGVY